MLCLSYYCLYSLFKKIRDKGRTVSAQKWGGKGERGREWGGEVRKGEGGVRGKMTQKLYAHTNKEQQQQNPLENKLLINQRNVPNIVFILNYYEGNNNLQAWP
jgi:flagellar hook assembly protein FlgD